MYGFDSVEILDVRRDDDAHFSISLSIPSSSSYFDGHFDSFKLLPALGEIDIVCNVSEEIVGRKLTVIRINRTKFTSPIKPEMVVTLALDYSKGGVVVFTYRDLNESVCSRGFIYYKDAEA